MGNKPSISRGFNDFNSFNDSHTALWYDEPLPKHDCLLLERSVSESDSEVVPLTAARYRHRMLHRTAHRSVRGLRRFKLLCMPSWCHPMSRHYFRSTASLNAERRRQMRSSTMLHPFSTIKYYWTLYMGVVLLTALIVYPLTALYAHVVRFNILDDEDVSWNFVALQTISMCLDLHMMFDVVVYLLTGVVDIETRSIHMEFSIIIRHYIKNKLIFHVVGAFPYSFLWIDDTHLLSSWLELLKLIRLPEIYNAASLFLYSRVHFWYVTKKIAVIILMPLLALHWVACGILIVSASVEGSDQTKWHPQAWLRKVRLGKSTMARLYGRLVDHAANYLFNLTPRQKQAPQDGLMAIIFGLVGGVLLIYVSLQCYAVFRIIFVATFQEAGKVRQLEEFMKYRDLPEKQRSRLVEYFSYCFSKLFFREYQVLDFVSGHLKEDIMMHSCHSALASVPFFKDLPLHVMVRIVLCLRNEIFMENEVVVQAGTPGNSMYFIVSGTVVIFSASGKEICHLQDGAHFGEIAMLSGDETRIASVVAIETCELYCLERDDFLNAVAAYPELLRSMEETALLRLDQTVSMDKKSKRFTSSESQRRAKQARRASLSLSGAEDLMLPPR